MLAQFAFVLPRTMAHAGQLDSGFAANGKAWVHFEDSTSSLTTGLTLDHAGRILVAARIETAHGSRFGLARLNHDGLTDPDFGTRGCVIGAFENGFDATAGKVIELPDGNILLSGLHYENNDHTFPALALFDQQGRCLALQADGHIVVGGAIDLPQHGLIARYDSSGKLDDSFGENGFLSILAQGHSVMVSQIVQDTNGDLQVFGSSRDPMHSLSLKVRPDGKPDRHCNQGQCQLMAIGSNASQWTAARLQSDGKLLTAGATIGGIEADFVLARHLPDASLDPDFVQGKGWVRPRLGYSLDTATTLAVQANGRILVGGYSLLGLYRAVIARYWA